MAFRLGRPPANAEELWWLVKAMWDVEIPRVAVCPGHCSPYEAFSEAYFGNACNYALWYGSRGTGKSYMLALLALTKAAVLDINVTLLGGSMAQSKNVHEHVETLLNRRNAPKYAIDRVIETEVSFSAGNWIRPLPASQTTVRGPHPQMTLLDEIDEMDRKIYDAAMGQALDSPNARNIKVGEMVVASSTWQNPIGTFQSVRDDALARGLPIRTWCFREVLRNEANPTGWMDPEFIERKRGSIPAEMFRVEYELGEPSGSARAIDLDAFNRCLVDDQPVRTIDKANDHLLVYADPLPHGHYATGADWAKEGDRTVICTWRTDVRPHRLVHVRSMNRKPWPEMIGIFNETTTKYQGSSAHDATGIGNVVGDLIDERTIKFVMVGRERTKMLTEYIAAVEKGDYAFPRSALRFITAHTGATVSDVYKNVAADSTSHLPDDVAASALAHRAATRQPVPGGGAAVPRQGDAMPPWMRSIDEPPKQYSSAVVAGEVVQVDPDDGVGVFWLLDQ